MQKIFLVFLFTVFGSISVRSGIYTHIPSQITMSERSKIIRLLGKRKCDAKYHRINHKTRIRHLINVLKPYKLYFNTAKFTSPNNPDIYQERLLVSNDILGIAISYGDLETLELLVNYGADANGTEYFSDYQYDELHFISPLTEAIIHGEFAIAKYLIKRGADVNGLVNGIKNFHLRINKKITKNDLLKSSKKGSPFYYAIYYDAFDMVDLLIENDVIVSKDILNLLYCKINEDKYNRSKIVIYEKLILKLKNYVEMQIEYENFCSLFDKTKRDKK